MTLHDALDQIDTLVAVVVNEIETMDDVTTVVDGIVSIDFQTYDGGLKKVMAKLSEIRDMIGN